MKKLIKGAAIALVAATTVISPSAQAHEQHEGDWVITTQDTNPGANARWYDHADFGIVCDINNGDGHHAWVGFYTGRPGNWTLRDTERDGSDEGCDEVNDGSNHVNVLEGKWFMVKVCVEREDDTKYGCNSHATTE